MYKHACNCSTVCVPFARSIPVSRASMFSIEDRKPRVDSSASYAAHRHIVCVNVKMYKRMNLLLCQCVHVWMCVYICVHVLLYAWMNACASNVRMDVYTFAYIIVRICVRMYVCMNVRGYGWAYSRRGVYWSQTCTLHHASQQYQIQKEETNT